jgi:uncharacterized caspase-like protein
MPQETNMNIRFNIAGKGFVLFFFFFGLNLYCNAQTNNRYALVIGNNNYQNNVNPLLTPVNDATDVSNSLKSLGYEVDLKLNTRINELDEIIDNFIIKLDSNRESEGFFWFAGHGVNIENKHYLLAIDVDPRNDNSIIRGSYSVDKLVERFDKVKNKANLLVIDACRNDFIPGARNISGRGLAIVASDSVVGNVIAYSTRAGQIAEDGKLGDRNSPFAAAFLNNIKTTKSFDNLFIQIANETRTRTSGRQLPYKIGYFTIEDYTIASLIKKTDVAVTPQNPNRERKGLTVIERPPTGMFIFYSTSEGNIAVDGNGRNSPFAEAFLNNIHKREPLNLLAIDIVSDTYRLTSQKQKPSYESRIITDKTYSIANSSANKRYALLIGNNNYRNIVKLKNPVNDVQDIARALMELGYEVDLRTEVNLSEMENAIAAFKRKLASEKESEGFFWFAGHGVQFDGENYLIPVDADIKSPFQLRTQALSISYILNELRSNNKINIFVFDAARDNPFGYSR